MGGLVVNVKQGWLRGAKVESIVGGSYISFKGIPYAAPPIGNLRFAEPRPPLPWTGMREALKEGSKCMQFNPTLAKAIGDEDCLYLNVATTSLKGSRAVIVWIHGGAFVSGDGGVDMYSPDYFMKTDVVLVSINYRVGVLGFLQLDHKLANGNMGLKDQVAALKWVKENIAQFGGNPNNVTIVGESAGSASVHYLLLSPLAKGLFHKAILQSGVALNPWACTPGSIDVLHRYVAALGKESTDPDEILKYLRTIPAHKLIEVQEEFSDPEAKASFLYPFRPSIDNKSQQPFLPRSPHELAAKGIDIPIIIGYNAHEGLLFLMGLTEASLALVDQKFDMTVTHELIEKAPSKISEVGKEIREFYFGDKAVTMETLDGFIKCYGNTHFVVGIQKVIEFQRTKKTPTYFYKFSHFSPNSFSKVFFNSSVEGTGHGDDLRYLFHPALLGDSLKIEPDSADQIVSDRFIRMWTDFARTGNPTPQIDDLITVKWEPITRTTKNCLNIGTELSMIVNPDEDIWELSKRIAEIVDKE